MKNKLLILLGHSNCGKSYTVKELLKTTNFKTCVSHTTRKKGVGEVEGIDYYYVTDDEFDKIKFVENREYNTFENINDKKTEAIWKYGLSESELKDLSKPRVVIVDLHGAMELSEYLNDEVVIVYLEIDEKIRMDRALSRNRESIEEIKRRFADDKKVFKGVENLVHATVNTEQSAQDVCEQILQVYNYYN